MAATALTPEIHRFYYTEADGQVAAAVTDGLVWWLADLNGDRISDFFGNCAQVTLAARRRFGRFARPYTPLTRG
jgi:hypothetical protein